MVSLVYSNDATGSEVTFCPGMKATDPKPTFSYIVSELVRRHPNFAYLHLIEPRVEGNIDRTVLEGEVRASYIL